MSTVFGKRRRHDYATPFSDRYVAAESRVVQDDDGAIQGVPAGAPPRWKPPRHDAPPQWTTEPAAHVDPVPVPRPGGPRPSAPRRAISAARSRLQPINDAITQFIGGWQPQSANDMIEFFDDALPRTFEHTGHTLHQLADRMTAEMPIAQEVADGVHDIGATFAGQMADTAREAAMAFRKAHETEIARVENPRAHEERWNRP